ncbi:hypothetical protein TWF694_004886 [Orbilia ellipsospora]|uniref:Synaptobrevin n=1 Tax=Orbilia ellipsospora TaxID=2528407 RepID=A0AAV9WV17_9PEZI
MRIQQSSSSYAANPTYISLARLLARLDQKLPAGPASHAPTSRPSAFEMAKLKANIEYANTLLQQLEADAGKFKNPSQRQKALSELQPQRNVAKRLNDMLGTLELLEDKTIIHVVEEPQVLKPVERTVEPDAQMASIPPPKPTPTVVTSQVLTVAPAAPTATVAPSNEPASVLRNRLSKSYGSEPKPELSLDDQLSQDRHEQDDLSESLMKMAAQLKENSRKFADDLENEKDILRTTAEGLDKNSSGVQGAGLRMLQLRQGQDVTWWYQIKVFAALIGLALTAVIIFWLPKLRWGSFF